MSKRIPVATLRNYCIAVFTKAGLGRKDAATVTDVLVMTDTWGTYSHGTGAVWNYVKSLRARGILADAQPQVISEGDSWALIDGGAGMGMLGACAAMKLAIEKARTHTIAFVGVRNGSHFGACGYYANMAAEHDMLGIAMSNADPNMAAPGARHHVIGNNPIAYAIPAENEAPILLDIALSTVAASKIFAMKALSQPIPPTWLTNADGIPTTEVGDWPATGSMMPMAGHKGYGLALLIEGLAGLATGAGVLDEVQSWILNPTQSAQLGQAFIVLNVGAMIPVKDFKQRVDQMIHKIHTAPKAASAERICVPGELEWERRRDALANGIPLPDLVWSSLREAGRELGVDTQIFDQEQA